MARNNDRDRGTRRAPKETGRRTKKKICIFCKAHATWVDYKDVNLLRKFMSDRGKIRATAACRATVPSTSGRLLWRSRRHVNWHSCPSPSGRRASGPADAVPAGAARRAAARSRTESPEEPALEALLGETLLEDAVSDPELDVVASAAAGDEGQQ